MASPNSRRGFHGAAPTVQRSGAAQGAVTATAVTVATTNAVDLPTAQALANSLKVQLNAVIADNVALSALVHEMRLVLTGKGLMKGAA